MQHIENLISSKMRFPTKTSTKKKRYVTFTCTSCGKIVEKIYLKSRWKSQCESCMKGVFTTNQFIKIGKGYFGNTYDYSKTVYINSREPVLIICPIHGEFTQRAQEHMAGHGCNQCKFDCKSANQTLPKEEWLKRIKAYPLIEVVNIDNLGWHSQVLLSCKIHGNFTTMLGQIGKAVHLCKECSYIAHQTQSIRPELYNTPAILYYVYLPQIGMYKFGVTIDLEKRLSTLGEYKLIATGTKEYTEALRLEHQAHKELVDYQYKGRKKLVKNGSTELYVIDVLPQLKRALQQ